jgi:hypothetical protein
VELGEEGKNITAKFEDPFSGKGGSSYLFIDNDKLLAASGN